VVTSVASVWIRKRATRGGGVRFRVEYRLGGRESRPRYAGSFRTQREALARKAWAAGELAAMRVPDLAALAAVPEQAPTVAKACERWRTSRVDVAEATRVLHRVALGRVLPILGDRRVDEVTVADVNMMVAQLAAAGRKRETIRKSVKYLAAVLEEHGVEPNPARDKRIRLPHEEGVELVPPAAEHVEAVFRLLARRYRLPLLWLDWSGARVASVESVLVGDYDEPGRRVRLRASTTKSRKALWVELPEVLAEAISATLPPREDRDGEARLFPTATADSLRTAIGRACKAVGVPVFSPHDLRHRRISLLHHQGRSWAEIGALVGQRKLSITADTYTHVLVDGREVDLDELLGHARSVPPPVPPQAAEIAA
jgi:integrase